MNIKTAFGKYCRYGTHERVSSVYCYIPFYHIYHRKEKDGDFRLAAFFLIPTARHPRDFAGLRQIFVHIVNYVRYCAFFIAYGYEIGGFFCFVASV